VERNTKIIKMIIIGITETGYREVKVADVRCESMILKEIA